MSQSLIQLSLPAGAQPPGALHAVFVKDSGQLSDIIDRILLEDGQEAIRELNISADALEKKDSWALQQVQQKRTAWTAQDFKDAGDGKFMSCSVSLAQSEYTLGLMDIEMPVATLLHDSQSSSVQDKSTNRLSQQYSDHLIAAHLHSPTLRLVYLPYCLEVTLSHLPGSFPDTAVVTTFFTGHSAANDVVEEILDEYCVPRCVQYGTKTAKPEFILSAKDIIGERRVIEPKVLVIDAIQQLGLTGPPFAVALSFSPDWLAQAGTVATGLSSPAAPKPRPKIGSRSASEWRPNSLFGYWSASTSQEAADVDQDQDPPEGGTVKAKHSDEASTPIADKQTSRLSSFFEGWFQDTSPPRTPTSSLAGRTVSNPVATAPASPGTFQKIRVDAYNSIDQELDPTNIDANFETLIKDMGIKGAQAESMRALSDVRKSYLLSQYQSSSIAPLRPQKTGPAESITGSLHLDWKRFSLSSLVGLDNESVNQLSPDESELSQSRRLSMSSLSGLPAASLSGWAAWFSSPSGGAPNTGNGITHESQGQEAVSEIDYMLDCLKKSKPGSTALVRQLINLRVRLSTERIAWINDFIQLQGYSTLHYILKTTRERQYSGQQKDVDDTIRLECVRCLRALLNTEVRGVCQMLW